MPVPNTTPKLTIIFTLDNLLAVGLQLTSGDLTSSTLYGEALAALAGNPSLGGAIGPWNAAAFSAFVGGTSAPARKRIEQKYRAKQLTVAQRNHLFSITPNGWSWPWVLMMVAQNA